MERLQTVEGIDVVANKQKAACSQGKPVTALADLRAPGLAMYRDVPVPRDAGCRGERPAPGIPVRNAGQGILF